MQQYWFFMLSVIAIATAQPDTANAEMYTISGMVPFAESNGASPKVSMECQLETKLPGFVRSYSKGDVSVTVTTDPLKDADGKVLHMEFSNVLGSGGGA
jgi:hypothetical protein